ncbi:hypothetical protein [Francisella orientalis]|uniref:hypothetical protein n=1 Tax=Francisella orientalis TaxID=299583 RepID=UPI001E5D5B07|nr:hypothetical protein [Francisella orientalis]
MGAFIVLLIAFLLSELAVKYPTNGLFTRLVTISHNQHFGFVTGLSNWTLGLIIVPLWLQHNIFLLYMSQLFLMYLVMVNLLL